MGVGRQAMLCGSCKQRNRFRAWRLKTLLDQMTIALSEQLPNDSPTTANKVFPVDLLLQIILCPP